MRRGRKGFRSSIIFSCTITPRSCALDWPSICRFLVRPLGSRASMNSRVPDFIPGYGAVRPFAGAFANLGRITRAPVQVWSARPGAAKVLPSIRAAIEACELKDGATVSFHHHLRNGDNVLNAVMAEIAALGLRDIKIAASSLFPVHAPLIEHIR